MLILFLLGVLTGILFGTVFCLRSQTVTVLGETPVDISREDIISAAGFKHGESIFMLDKTSAINNIEDKFSHIKVVQIKTTGLTKVEIRIRARHEMFYTEYNKNYYVMDEELKVLNIIEEAPEGETSKKPTNLIEIPATNLNINTSTLKCDFVGGKSQEVICEFYHSIINNVKNINDGEKEYYTRADVKDIVKKVELVHYNSFTKIVIQTKYGVVLDIENPTENLTDKMNVCLSTIKTFLLSPDMETQIKAQEGTIKIYYDLNNNQVSVYIPQVNENE